MKQQLIKLSLIGAMLFLVPVQSWAMPITVDINVQNGSFPGFTATFIHKNSTAGGTAKFKELEGKLLGILDVQGGVLKLNDIKGKLTSAKGKFKGSTVTIHNGSITDSPSTRAWGSFSYSVFAIKYGSPYSNHNITNGTFTFFNNQPANFLRPHATTPELWELQLWGGDPTNKKGMDFRANIVENPEPTTILLFGTGLAGLGFL